jgi:hypothetical protein
MIILFFNSSYWRDRVFILIVYSNSDTTGLLISITFWNLIVRNYAIDVLNFDLTSRRVGGTLFQSAICPLLSKTLIFHKHGFIDILVLKCVNFTSQRIGVYRA